MTDASGSIPDGPVNPIETDYTIGQDNIQSRIGPFGFDTHNPVFVISGATIVAFVVFTLAFQNHLGPLFVDLRGWLTSCLVWFLIGAANVSVLLCLFLVVSPLGRVRLGGPDAAAEDGGEARPKGHTSISRVKTFRNLREPSRERSSLPRKKTCTPADVLRELGNTP